MSVGFLIDTKKKADKQLMVIMWCQIFGGKSIAMISTSYRSYGRPGTSSGILDFFV